MALTLHLSYTEILNEAVLFLHNMMTMSTIACRIGYERDKDKLMQNQIALILALNALFCSPIVTTIVFTL